MRGSHRPLSSFPSRPTSGRLGSLLGSLALAGLGSLALACFGLTSLGIARADDPPPRELEGLAIPISGNVYTLPEEHAVEIWTGHLGGDCQPKRLATAKLFDPRCAIQTSADGSTLAYLTSSGVAFERRDEFAMSRAHLQGGFQPGVAGAAELVLSSSGRRAAYVTHEGAADLLRTTLWTVDLGAGTEPGPLPAKVVTPARVKRSGPGVGILPVGWSPSGQSLIYLEQIPVRGQVVSVLVVRDVRAQTEGEIDRRLERIDFAIPIQTGAGTGTYRVLVGAEQSLRWVYPNGARPEVVRGPSGAPLLGQGITEIVASRRQPLDVALRMAWPATQPDGRIQSGVYRLRGNRVQQLTSERGSTSVSYGPDGTLCLAESASLRLFSDKTDATLELTDAQGNALDVRASSWHSWQPMLAIALEDELLVLDLSGKLPDDAQRGSGWSQFVGLRAPGQPKPTLHRALRLAASSKQRITRVLWHGDRLVWTLQEPPRMLTR